MSDYHPDGAQLFFPERKIPFVVCLGKNTCGDDVTPQDMRAFYIPAGKGVYFHPGTWHNGVYIAPEHSPATFMTRQGRVHGRVSASWASEFATLLRVPLAAPDA
jgi:ureidoglycolate lyase/seryl-tRNA synthetase